jgi:hypothetical protein
MNSFGQAGGVNDECSPVRICEGGVNGEEQLQAKSLKPKAKTVFALGFKL